MTAPQLDAAGDGPANARSARLAEYAGLLVVVAIAAYLRWYLHTSGAPELVFPREDEVHYVSLVQQFLAGNPRVVYFVNPTLYAYVTYAATALGGWTLVALGSFDSYSDFVLDAKLNPYYATIAGRLVTIVASLASIVVVYDIGKRVASAPAGWIAALALACNWTHLDRSALCGNEVLMVLFVLLTFRALLGYLATPTAARHAGAGVLLGLAAATKYSAGIQAVLLVAASLAAWSSTGPRRPRALVGGRYVAGFVAAPLAFLCASPYVLIERERFWRQFSKQASFLDEGYTRGDAALERSGWLQYLLDFPDQNNGLAFAVLCLAGSVAALFLFGHGRRRPVWMLSIASLPAFAYLGSGTFVRMRFLLVAIPFFLLAGAWLLDALVAWIVRARATGLGAAARPWVACGLAAVLLGPRTLAAHERMNRIYGGGSIAVAHEWFLDAVDPEGQYIDLVIPSNRRTFAVPNHLRAIPAKQLEANPALAARVERMRAPFLRSISLTLLVRKHKSFDTLRAHLAEGPAEALLVHLHLVGRQRVDDPRLALERVLEDVPNRGIKRRWPEYWGEVAEYLGDLEMIASDFVDEGKGLICVLRLR